MEGCAALIWKDGRLLFVINKRKYWKTVKGKLFVSFAGVGGKKEEQENIVQTTIRECKEEIGVFPTILSSRKTFFIDLDYRVTTKKINITPKPFSIYLVRVKGKPGKPYARGWFIAKIYVFLAKLRQRPIPLSEIPALIWLDWNMVLLSLRKNVKLNEFLKRGAEIKEREKIPRNAILKPTWTPKIFAKAFGKNFPTFLEASLS